MSTVKQKPLGLTKKDVERRLRDWERRIKALFRKVEEWGVAEWGKESVQRGTIEQRNEYVMQQFGVRPRKLPTLTLLAGERRITLVPSCLWIVRANGRVDLNVDHTFYTLLDMGGKDRQPSDWQIVNPDPRVVLEPFTREVFLGIARGT